MKISNGMKKVLLIILFVAIFFAPARFLYAKGKVSAPVKQIKLLIVPGHDNQVWGAQYGNIKEADMNLALATRISNILKKDKRFEVHITRNSAGYTKEFTDYFANNQDAISAFKENAKTQMKTNITNGNFVQKVNPPHRGVSEDVAIKLYSINKWADENEMDAVIHIHFNDYPRPNKWTLGKYKGFTIYEPEGQMVNSVESQKLAGKIFTQLHKKYSTSTYEKELGGLIPDQSLIALGSNGTLIASVRSVLIEYGYIYEKKFRKSSARRQAYKTMAELTTTGTKKYFFPK